LLEARALLSEHLEGGRSGLRLVCGSYAEAHEAFRDYDAAAMVETIEHVRPEELSAVERAVFGSMRPRVLYLTTPNREYNPLFGLSPGERREPDHQFEWDRARFRRWTVGVAGRNGYRVTLGGLANAIPNWPSDPDRFFRAPGPEIILSPSDLADNRAWSRPDSRCGASHGGKSGLHRAGCQVTPGRREPTESATENIPPTRFGAGKGEMVR
jgi:hypothetical protein